MTTCLPSKQTAKFSVGEVTSQMYISSSGLLLSEITIQKHRGGFQWHDAHT
jgi:hypothetical protein